MKKIILFLIFFAIPFVSYGQFQTLPPPWDTSMVVHVDDNGDTITVNGAIGVTGTFWQATQPVSGTFWQATQPISINQTTTNNDVDVATIAVGDNNIGNVDVVTMPTVTVNTHAVTVASGGIASGAIASGAVASGAVASGAFASGSIAAGAVVAGAASFVKTEDATSADLDAGVPLMAIQKAVPANTGGTDGDYTMLQMSNGRLWTLAILGANSGIDIGDVDVTSVVPLTGATNLGKGEDLGHTSGDVGVMPLAVRNDAGTVLAGATADYIPVTTGAEGGVWVSTLTSTTGGWSTFMATSADGSTALTNTAQAIKASAGNFGGYFIYNPNTSAVYVHIYNVVAASVIVGTTNPTNTFCIPASSGANLEISKGIYYSTAMSCAATTTGGGNTAPTTALEANFWYK
jgi:hypothetical protein